MTGAKNKFVTCLEESVDDHCSRWCALDGQLTVFWEQLERNLKNVFQIGQYKTSNQYLTTATQYFQIV